MRVKILILLIYTAMAVQSQNPGGVSGYLYWNQPEKGKKAGDLVMNHNAVKKFAAPGSKPVFTSNKHHLSGITFFCVSLTDSIKERALWRIETDSATNILMTNRRMANLEEMKYINFSTPKKAVPQISVYSQKAANGDSLAGNIYIHIGSKTGNNVPIDHFEGVLPELIVYNRVLSYNERLRVESYLAIKYGISLSQIYPTSYLNAQGGVIWDAARFAAYSGAIAGVGRDDISGLCQQKSGSMETPGLLEIECLNLSDREFLVWGDNKAALTFIRKRGEGKKMNRRWAIAATGNFLQKPSTLRFSALHLQEMYPLENDEQYWLAIDHSGTGTFPAGQTRYYANNPNHKINLQFDGINWDANQSGHDLFTIIAAPELFAAFNFIQPTCKNNRQGTITADIVGGTAPYTVQLFRNGEMVTKQTSDNQIHSFTHLNQGTYRVTVVDAYNKTYSETFLLANADMEQVVSFEPLTRIAGTDLRVDASKGLSSASNYRFEWKTPDGTTIFQPEIIVNKPGVYLLTVTNSDGCCTQRELDVREKPSDYFRYVEVYPNPTSDGYVYLRVQLKNAGPVQVSISNAAGHLLSSEKLSGADYYSFNCKLPHTGFWLITLEGNGERKSYKIISNAN